MPEVSPDQLKQAVEYQHGGIATFVQAVPVHEEHAGQTVWDGTVSIFDLAANPKATRAYAWSYERADGTRRMFAVLHVPPISGPRDAVRAAIVAESRATKMRPGAFLFSGKWAPVVKGFGESGMGYTIVGVTLANGREFSQCVLMGGYLTQVRGLPDVPFTEDDIVAIKPTHKRWNFSEMP